MASKIKVDQLETADGSGTIALQNQLSGMTSASMPTGSVLQVVQSSSVPADRTTSSSTSAWVTHYGLAITPSSTSSKILIQVTQPLMLTGSSNMNRGGLRIERGSATIWNTDDFREHVQLRNADTEGNQISHITYLDSPSTTSATTYNLQFSMMSGSGMYMFDRAEGANMVLMEIAG